MGLSPSWMGTGAGRNTKIIQSIFFTMRGANQDQKDNKTHFQIPGNWTTHFWITHGSESSSHGDPIITGKKDIFLNFSHKVLKSPRLASRLLTENKRRNAHFWHFYSALYWLTNQNNKARKRNKKPSDWNRTSNILSVFRWQILYFKNPKESIKMISVNKWVHTMQWGRFPVYGNVKSSSHHGTQSGRLTKRQI